MDGRRMSNISETAILILMVFFMTALIDAVFLNGILKSYIGL